MHPTTKLIRKAYDTAFNNRCAFNHGYHDAVFDCTRYRPRLLVDAGPQTPEQVSREFSHFYYEGYRHGMMDCRDQRPQQLSTEAWFDAAVGCVLIESCQADLERLGKSLGYSVETPADASCVKRRVATDAELLEAGI